MRIRETKWKKGPRDVVDVSWATGVFFSFLILLTNFLGTNLTVGTDKHNCHHEHLLAGWDPFCHQKHYSPGHNDTAMSICSWGGSLSWPQQWWHNIIVIFSSCAQRRPQLQVFPDTGAVTWWEMVGLPVPTDPQLVNLWVAGMGKAWVWVWVHSKVPTGYPCGSLVTMDTSTSVYFQCLMFFTLLFLYHACYTYQPLYNLKFCLDYHFFHS